jgi:hypothetical protein
VLAPVTLVLMMVCAWAGGAGTSMPPTIAITSPRATTRRSAGKRRRVSVTVGDGVREVWTDRNVGISSLYD